MSRTIRDLLLTALLALGLFLLLQASIQNTRVVYASMEPTLNDGELLLVNKLAYWNTETPALKRLAKSGGDTAGPVFLFEPPKRGDIVVLSPPFDNSPRFIKRVVGLPNETIRIHAGKIFINGTELKEPYLKENPSGYLSARKIASNHYFVLGDNREISNDSRDWGSVPLRNIVGKAWISYWPLPVDPVIRERPFFVSEEVKS